MNFQTTFGEHTNQKLWRPLFLGAREGDSKLCSDRWRFYGGGSELDLDRWRKVPARRRRGPWQLPAYGEADVLGAHCQLLALSTSNAHYHVTLLLPHDCGN